MSHQDFDCVMCYLEVTLAILTASPGLLMAPCSLLEAMTTPFVSGMPPPEHSCASLKVTLPLFTVSPGLLMALCSLLVPVTTPFASGTLRQEKRNTSWKAILILSILSSFLLTVPFLPHNLKTEL